MTRVLRAFAASAGAAAVVLYGVALLFAFRIDTEDRAEGLVWGTSFLIIALIGAVLALRLPRNRVGWLLLMAGMGEVLAGGATLYGEYSASAGSSGALSATVGWIGGSLWALSVAAMLVFLPLYFPTGKPPSPRWRWIGWLGTAGLVLLLSGPVDIAVFRPELMGRSWEAVEAAAGDRPVFRVSEYGFDLLLAAGPFALLSLVVRFVRSRGEERAQIKLLVFAAAVTLAFVVVTNNVDLPRGVQAIATAVALPSMGVATMIAVLRYRLFDVDRVISRTVAYGALSVLLIGIYLAAVTLLTAVTAPVTGDSPLSVAAATLLAAAAFQPARRRIQAVVDRRFNRARYDARRTAEAFATSMRQEVDLDDVHARLVDTVVSVFEPSAVTMLLTPGSTRP